MDGFLIGLGIHSDPDSTVVAISAPGGPPELLTAWRELPNDLMALVQCELRNLDPELAVGAVQVSGTDAERVWRGLAGSADMPRFLAPPLEERGKLLTRLFCIRSTDLAAGPIAVLVVDASMDEIVFTGCRAARSTNGWKIDFRTLLKAQHTSLHVTARLLAAQLNSNQVRVNVEPSGGAWDADSVRNLMCSHELVSELRKLHAQLSKVFPRGRAAADLANRFPWWSDVQEDVDARCNQVRRAAASASDTAAKNALLDLVDAPLHVFWVGAESDFCLFRDEVEGALAPLARGRVKHATLSDSESSPSHRQAFSAAQAASVSLLGTAQHQLFTVEIGYFDEINHNGLDPTWHTLLSPGPPAQAGHVRLKRIVPAGASGAAHPPLIPVRITRRDQSWYFDWEIAGLQPGQQCDIKARIDAALVLELQAIGVDTREVVSRWGVQLRQDKLAAKTAP